MVFGVASASICMFKSWSVYGRFIVKLMKSHIPEHHLDITLGHCTQRNLASCWEDLFFVNGM